MKILITIGEIFELDMWKDICEMLGYYEYAVKEGYMTMESEIVLSEMQAKELGLIS